MRTLIGAIVMLFLLPGMNIGQSNPITFMNNAQFSLFLRDLSGASSRWQNAVSEVDLSTLTNLPYAKRQVMDEAKANSLRDLSFIQVDIDGLTSGKNTNIEIRLLKDLEDSKDSVNAFASDLHMADATDTSNYAIWEKDVDSVYGEVSQTSLTLYGQLEAVSRVIDRKMDINTITRADTFHPTPIHNK